MSAVATYTKYLIWAIVIGLTLYIIGGFFGLTASLCLAPFGLIQDLFSNLFDWITAIIDFLRGLPGVP